ncbi:MAG TPA: radical SAM protein [Usitatibacter sp.]|nr:radical SAM protein [Usitatibacter sp.]
MSRLMEEMGARALEQGIPLAVHLDLTYRCNERCVHCYLDHDDHGEMSTAEILRVLDEVAQAGTFFLTLSGGEIFMRRDLFEIIAHARKRMFAVKLKSNAVMVTRAKAARLARLGVAEVQVSVYSHRAEAHDAITKLPGSLRRTLEGVKRLREQGIKVTFANVLMKGNEDDYREVRSLALELGAGFTIDPMITPMMDGSRDVLALNIDAKQLAAVYRDESLTREAPPAVHGDDAKDMLPCSAGHTLAYISPYGEVFPCVQFPYSCGNVRQQRFIDIWKDSPQLANVRSVRLADVQGCSTCVHGGSCTRCPGLAYVEVNLRGPSTQDCERSYAVTGVASENLKRRKRVIPIAAG